MENTIQQMKENTVFVGNKPIMNYVLAVVIQFNNGANEVTIKARGKAISRAVDTAEIALNRFLKGVEKKDIITSTEIIDTDPARPTFRVSRSFLLLQTNNAETTTPGPFFNGPRVFSSEVIEKRGAFLLCAWPILATTLIKMHTKNGVIFKKNYTDR